MYRKDAVCVDLTWTAARVAAKDGLTFDELLQVITNVAQSGRRRCRRELWKSAGDRCKSSHSEKYTCLVPGALLLECNGERTKRIPQVGRVATTVPKQERGRPARNAGGRMHYGLVVTAGGQRVDVL